MAHIWRMMSAALVPEMPKSANMDSTLERDSSDIRAVCASNVSGMHAVSRPAPSAKREALVRASASACAPAYQVDSARRANHTIKGFEVRTVLGSAFETWKTPLL